MNPEKCKEKFEEMLREIMSTSQINNSFRLLLKELNEQMSTRGKINPGKVQTMVDNLLNLYSNPKVRAALIYLKKTWGRSEILVEPGASTG